MNRATMLCQSIAVASAVLAAVSAQRPAPEQVQAIKTAVPTPEQRVVEPLTVTVFQPVTLAPKPAPEPPTPPTPSLPEKATEPKLPEAFGNYSMAALEASRTRELLVALHNGASLSQQNNMRVNMANMPGTEKFAWLIVDANSMIDGKTAQEFFEAPTPTSTIRHNLATGENKLVTKQSDLEN